MTHAWTIERARELDRADEIGRARGMFLLPEGIVYLDGNSLGALSTGVAGHVGRLVEKEWGSRLIAGWTGCGWMEAPERIGDRIAPLIGAMPGEVIVADTTTIALAKLLGAALNARPSRKVILSSADNFPSDLFSAGAVARLFGAELRIVDRSEIAAALADDVAVCCLTHVDFRTGEMHDLPAITARTHDVGALSLWDLCHSAGAVVVGLEEHGVDLAVGCTYKYLNGGPGSQSFMYVRRALQAELENPLPGWLGHEAPFDFEPSWTPAAGIRRFLTSSPPIISMAALEAALEAFDGVSIEQVRAKSLSLSQLFLEAVEERAPASLVVVSPRDQRRRGSQISLRHENARSIIEGAAARGVVGDFRAPDLCRFGFTPLYLSHEDVLRAAEVVAEGAAGVAAGVAVSD
ncbi:MAG: kynureninase [Acidimicrobiales bacterium]